MLNVVVIADLNPANAKAACRGVCWTEELIEKTHFTDDAITMMHSDGIDVVIEVTGYPVVGTEHARGAIRNGLHVVMVKLEADVLAGPLLGVEARLCAL